MPADFGQQIPEPVLRRGENYRIFAVRARKAVRELNRGRARDRKFYEDVLRDFSKPPR